MSSFDDLIAWLAVALITVCLYRFCTKRMRAGANESEPISEPTSERVMKEPQSETKAKLVHWKDELVASDNVEPREASPPLTPRSLEIMLNPTATPVEISRRLEVLKITREAELVLKRMSSLLERTKGMLHTTRTRPATDSSDEEFHDAEAEEVLPAASNVSVTGTDELAPPKRRKAKQTIEERCEK